MGSPAKKAGGIALLFGAPKGDSKEEADEADPMKTGADEYAEEFAEAMDPKGDMADRAAAMKRFVMSCMGKG